MRLLFFFVFFLLLPTYTHAAMECLKQVPQSRHEKLLPETGELSATMNLKAKNFFESFSTEAQLSVSAIEGEMNLELAYPTGPNIVGLPYNVYLIAIWINGYLVHYQDFTRGCKSVGLSFFPNGKIKIPTIKLAQPWQDYCFLTPCKLRVQVLGNIM